MKIGNLNDLQYLILPIKLKDPISILKLISINIQLMRAEIIAGYEHILSSIRMAIRAWKNNRNIAKSLTMEVILYASATRQIKDAINKIGISRNSKECVALVISEDVKPFLNELLKYGEEDESIMEITSEKIPLIMEAFNIKESELMIAKSIYNRDEIAIQSLVLERVALSELFR